MALYLISVVRLTYTYSGMSALLTGITRINGKSYISDQGACLTSLAAYGPRTDPKFARGLIKSYAEGKLAKGQSKAQVSQKLDRLEAELKHWDFNFLAPVFHDVRRQLSLLPSNVWPLPPRLPVSGRTTGPERAVAQSRIVVGVTREPEAVAAAAVAPNGILTPLPAYERTDSRPDPETLALLLSGINVDAPPPPPPHTSLPPPPPSSQYKPPPGTALPDPPRSLLHLRAGRRAGRWGRSTTGDEVAGRK